MPTKERSIHIDCKHINVAYFVALNIILINVTIFLSRELILQCHLMGTMNCVVFKSLYSHCASMVPTILSAAE